MSSARVGRIARHWLGRLLWLIGALLVLATLIPIINSNHWWIRNLVFPQAQITAVIAVVMFLAIVALDRSRTSVRLLIAGLAAAIVYQLFYLLPYTPLVGTTVPSIAQCPPGRSLKLVEANVKADNPDHRAVLSMVAAEDPDIFFAVETDDTWRQALEPLRQRYPYFVAAKRNDYWGMMLFSRFPLDKARVEHLVENYVPSIRADVTLPSGATFVFHGLHPRPPMRHGSAKGDADLVRAGVAVSREGRPAIVTGDLNDVPWSSTTQLFGQLSGMSDLRVGRGFIASFDANNRLARWPLDHVFVTPGLRVMAFARLGDDGSDHFPMTASLCLLPGRQGDTAPGATASAWRRARQIISSGQHATGK